MNTELVEKTALEIITEKDPCVLSDNKIEAHQCTNHIAFGGKHHDTYGWLELKGVVIIATGISPYGRSTKEFSNLKDAILFCITERFHFKK